MKDKRKKLVFYIFIASITIVFSGTFAFLYNQITGNKQLVINSGVLDLVLEEENEITISDALPMYDQVGMIQEDVFEFRLVNKTTNDTNYILKLQEIETGTLDKSIVKYGLIKDGERTIDFVSNIADGIIDEGTIKGNDTIDYELRLWIDSSVTKIEHVEKKFLSFKMSASASQEIPKSPSSVEMKLFADENLGESCKTYNDGVDTFLVGKCQNNYVWYSGKLWRVVLKNNETGAVKMVTDNVITAIPYNEDGNVVFKDSYMDQWLNQEFLSTLHDYEDYLVVDSVWDTTENSSSTPTRPAYTTQVTRTVGLLNSYEHYTTHNNSDGLATKETGYLNNLVEDGFGVLWWLINPYDASNMCYVDYFGELKYVSPSHGNGARPSVNLKSTIKITTGSGIQSDPYILEGDLQERVNGTTLLNTRYSGEYITFNNELYRIVDIENGLTKITAVDNPTTLSSVEFDSNHSASFADASIKTDLENYYQGLKSTNETAYNMIEPNTTWYLGTVGKGANYKASICATVDVTKSMNACTDRATSTAASIGLPRVGEMFTGWITRGTKKYFWTLTPYDLSSVRLVTNTGYLSQNISLISFGARPSMYLKQNVVIASDNTGNGTYEHPYKIELGA